jgi:hypothetical protein
MFTPVTGRITASYYCIGSSTWAMCSLKQKSIITNVTMLLLIFLLAYLDSNQDKQNQNLSYYHYTIGQSLNQLISELGVQK